MKILMILFGLFALCSGCSTWECEGTRKDPADVYEFRDDEPRPQSGFIWKRETPCAPVPEY